MGYVFLFVLLIIDLFAFVFSLRTLAFGPLVMQLFVLFAYFIIAAIVLFGVSRNRRWGYPAAAVLFFAQIVNAALIYAPERALLSLLVGVLASVGFLFAIVKIKPKQRVVAAAPVMAERPAVVTIERSPSKKAPKRSVRRAYRSARSAPVRKSSYKSSRRSSRR